MITETIFHIGKSYTFLYKETESTTVYDKYFLYQLGIVWTQSVKENKTKFYKYVSWHFAVSDVTFLI